MTRALLPHYGCASLTRDSRSKMKTRSQLMCVLTDSQFLIPLAVFVVGLVMLIVVH